MCNSAMQSRRAVTERTGSLGLDLRRWLLFHHGLECVRRGPTQVCKCNVISRSVHLVL